MMTPSSSSISAQMGMIRVYCVMCIRLTTSIHLFSLCQDDLCMHAFNASTSSMLTICSQVYAGETFPTRFRASGHGISAAAGKVYDMNVGSFISLTILPPKCGALISSLVFNSLTNKIGTPNVLWSKSVSNLVVYRPLTLSSFLRCLCAWGP
jgi:hypothetical protein